MKRWKPIPLHKGAFCRCCWNRRDVILFGVVRKITATRENRGELLGDEVMKTASHRNYSLQVTLIWTASTGQEVGVSFYIAKPLCWFQSQPLTSVASARFFLLNLGFFCFIWGFGVFIENLFFLLWSNFCKCIGGSRGALRGLKSPLYFFRYVFRLMVPDTETSIEVIFLDRPHINHFLYRDRDETITCNSFLAKFGQSECVLFH